MFRCLFAAIVSGIALFLFNAGPLMAAGPKPVAPQGQGVLHIQIYNADGHAAASATVHLKCRNAGKHPVLTKTADASGLLIVTVPAGSYTIKATAQGMHAKVSTVVAPNATVKLVIDLQRGSWRKSKKRPAA
jgi:hypothetical protein